MVLPAANDLDSGYSQQDYIASWRHCVDDNLTRLKTEGRSAKSSVDNTLIACQGHREDVLATFPDHLHKPLQELMVQQTWERGYEAWSPELRDVVQSASHLLR